MHSSEQLRTTSRQPISTPHQHRQRSRGHFVVPLYSQVVLGSYVEIQTLISLISLFRPLEIPKACSGSHSFQGFGPKSLGHFLRSEVQAASQYPKLLQVIGFDFRPSIFFGNFVWKATGLHQCLFLKCSASTTSFLVM